MTLDGRRIVDMDAQEIDFLQIETQSLLWDKHGVKMLEDYDPAKDKFVDDLMYGKDGNGWIDQAKQLGLIRKRTKEERESHHRELDAILR